MKPLRCYVKTKLRDFDILVKEPLQCNSMSLFVCCYTTDTNVSYVSLIIDINLGISKKKIKITIWLLKWTY